MTYYYYPLIGGTDYLRRNLLHVTVTLQRVTPDAAYELKCLPLGIRALKHLVFIVWTL